MTDNEPTLRYLDLEALRQLTAGLSFTLVRCAEVLDDALCSLNDTTGLIDKLIAWIEAGAFESGPGPYVDQPRIIVDVTETANADGQHGYFALVLRKSDEKESAPVVFLSMHSPVLDIPMRVELPLRALLKGNPPIKDTYTLYLHALMTDRGDVFTYYGITKRGWSIRFDEHTRAAVAQKSKRLLARTLNELIEARVAERMGVIDPRPKLAGIVTAVCGIGMERAMAVAAEERMVEKYSLAAKHPFGLNMIPGGEAGIRHARRFS